MLFYITRYFIRVLCNSVATIIPCTKTELWSYEATQFLIKEHELQSINHLVGCILIPLATLIIICQSQTSCSDLYFVSKPLKL